jgi:hypothetical protein
MAAKKKRKTKRKLSAAHLKALQAGLKRYKRAKAAKATSKRPKAKRAAPKRRTVRKRKTRVVVTVSNPTQWWRLKYRLRGRALCAIGKGSHESARKRAQAFADREGVKIQLCGPYPNREAAVAACQ